MPTEGLFGLYYLRTINSISNITVVMQLLSLDTEIDTVNRLTRGVSCTYEDLIIQQFHTLRQTLRKGSSRVILPGWLD